MYKLNEKQDFEYITFPLFDKYDNLLNCFTTRKGGVSQGSFESMNIGFKTGDIAENVKRNIEIMAEKVGIDVADIVGTSQTHTNNIKYVSEEHKGRIFSNSAFKEVDGIYTDRKNVALMSFHADCTPIFFYDPYKKVIGLAHAGWRGTLQNISGIMVRAFVKDFNSNPEDIITVIGPSLGQCCFEVDGDVAKLFLAEDEGFKNYMEIKGPKYHFNLWQINKYLLMKEGIREENIEISGLCTKCHNDMFFSHRGQGGKRGLMAGILMIK
ncbi:MAG TPA: peptidoglycan editing factor PgeF [Clostridiales bacterium]|nr:peptidoglycan editing factor PgeF [Clostridiales bacterium]